MSSVGQHFISRRCSPLKTSTKLLSRLHCLCLPGRQGRLLIAFLKLFRQITLPKCKSLPSWKIAQGRVGLCCWHVCSGLKDCQTVRARRPLVSTMNAHSCKVYYSHVVDLFTVIIRIQGSRECEQCPA